jgi:protein-S-isoprenylcysteine O-methyltransferase Ste14
MAEDEAVHRRALERWIVKGDVVRSILGVVFAFLLGVGALGFGTYLVINGAAIAGTIFAGVGLASLVWAFIYGTRARQGNGQ